MSISHHCRNAVFILYHHRSRILVRNFSLLIQICVNLAELPGVAAIYYTNGYVILVEVLVGQGT